MKRVEPAANLAITLMVAMGVSGSAWAGDIRVPAGGALQPYLENAEPGDRLRLAAGEHHGPIVIDKPLTISGHPGAQIIGSGAGTVVTVAANDSEITGLEITGSGSSHEDLDSGIKVIRDVERARILNNHLQGNLVGVDVHGGIDALVRGNTIIGRLGHRMNERGNGVYIWNAPGTIVDGNDIRNGRDGVFVNTSRENRFTNNRFSNLRFAIHYMYTHSSEVSGNRSSGNHAGYALMYSKDMIVRDNLSDGDRDHGIMLNYVNGTRVTGNRVLNGGKKCLFMYNANKNRITDNLFSHCPIGIHFTAGSERNVVAGNGFIGNRTQVKYVGSRWLEWSEDERGNYWSDHTTFDLDGDGRADMPYRPNDIVDHILWSQPAARLLLGSPAIQLIRWAQARFPALLPGGIQDSGPLMHPPVAARSNSGDAT